MIVRGSDQISWISNYLSELMSKKRKHIDVTFHVFLTMRKKLKSFHSYLFWRALLLLSLKNSMKARLGINVEEDPFTNSPVRIQFGRPDFEKLFEKILAKNRANHNVYVCAPQIISRQVEKVCTRFTKRSGFQFVLNTETFE